MSTNSTDNKNYGKQFLSGVAILAISTFIVKIIGLFYKIPMMAYLGAEGMGYFNSAYDIYSLFFVVSTTGIPVAISILVSENKVQGKITNIKKIFNISVIVLGVLGFIGTFFLCFFNTKMAEWIRNNYASYSILAISPTLFLICISSAIRGYFQGNQIMLPTAISQIIEAIGKLLLGLGFAIIAINKGYSMPIVASYAALGLTLSVGLSLCYLIFYKLFYKMRYSQDIINANTDSNKSILKKLLQIALPITISSTILSLTKIIDMTMILRRLNDIGYTQTQANAVYGSYSTMAVSLYNLPTTLISAISLPLVPMLASAIKAKDVYKEKSVISSALKLTALIGLPAGLGISVFSNPILALLFSSQTNEVEYVAPLLSLLGMSIFLSSMITTTNAILQAYQLVYKPIISMMLGTLAKIVSSYLLIGTPKINIYGAPISTLISVIIIVSVNLYFIIKQSGKLSSVYSLFIKPFIATVISIICGTGIYFLLDNLLSTSINIFITILSVVIIYLVFILKLNVIDSEEMLMLPKGENLLRLLKKTKFI